MATADEIYGQVDLLVDAYGRTVRPDSRLYDAYEAALSDVEFDHLRRGVISLLRDKLQFMPTPAEVRAHARAAKDYDNQRAAVEDSRRLVCVRCQDVGYLRTVSRRWLAEHRDRFSPDWFAKGWLREAFAWCRKEFAEDILVYVVCGCSCRKSQMYERQIKRWDDAKEDRSAKIPHPAFMNFYDDDWDCIVERSGDKEKSYEEDIRDLLLEMEAADTRTWKGNWNP